MALSLLDENMIDDLRDEIDKIDKKMVELLSQRAEIALEIGEEKNKEGREVTDREREKAVLDRVKKLNNGPFSDEQLERVYRTVMSEMKEIQEEVGVNDSCNEARGD